MQTPATRRLAHVKSHLDQGFNLDNLIHNITTGRGNPAACVMGLASHAQASAMYAWFGHHDLRSLRQWCYVEARLDQRWYQIDHGTHNPVPTLRQLLAPLVSNDEPLIQWFVHDESRFDSARIEDHKTHDFWAYQAIVALRGEWERLIARCNKALSDPPKGRDHQKFLADYEFYLALAHRDLDRMSRALQHRVSPHGLRAYSNLESGYTNQLISTPAVINAKIGWRHGMEVNVDSPYIPAEWLPNDPLDRYDPHYDFLR